MSKNKNKKKIELNKRKIKKFKKMKQEGAS